MGRAHDERQAARFYVGVGVGVVGTVAAIVAAGGKRTVTAAESPTVEGHPSACAGGFEPIAGDACFAAAPMGAPLVVYLHGLYGRETEEQELARQARLARLAKARRFSVVVLRGRQGQCSDPQKRDWWCWPSNEKNADDGPLFVERWRASLDAANAIVGPKGPRWLLGFSNGGYFAALIATRALAPFDAVVVAHAGPVEPTHALGKKPPMLLVTADDDPSNDEVLRLSSDLQRDAWPHEIVAREGTHDLTEWDAEMALTFFARTRTERLPLKPPLSTRRPRRTAPDAGVAPEDAAAVAPSTAPSTLPSPPSAPPEEAEHDE